MNKVLITGCAGYIGSIAADLFLKNNYQVVGIDNFQTGYRQPIEILKKHYQKKFQFYNLDLKDDLSLVFKENPDISVVVHYASSCLVDESMRYPEKYFKNNVIGSLNLITIMNDFNIRRIIFSSTCAVYGEGRYFPIDEKHPLEPSSPYGVSKKMVEEIISWFGKLKNFSYFILRYFNVCGASDDALIGDSKKPSTLLVQNAIRGALKIEPFYLTCPEVDTPDKTPIRDYINVVDLNEAHLLAVEMLLKEKKQEIINLGTGTGYSVLEVINEVKNITGVKFEIKKALPRQGEDAKKISSIEKAEKILNWRPKRSLKDSVISLIKWYKNHPYGWDD